MEYLSSLVRLLNVASALGVIVMVLLQHGKGADMGAAFGSGASGSLFGASGSANFLSRSTAVLATVFFVTCLGLAYMSSHREAPKGVMDVLPATPATQSAPAKPVPAPVKPAGEIPK